MSWAAIKIAESRLRDQRIKEGVDYALTFKFAELRIMCNELYEASIREAFAEEGIHIARIFTYR